jgi:hypothetical protein
VDPGPGNEPAPADPHHLELAVDVGEARPPPPVELVAPEPVVGSHDDDVVVPTRTAQQPLGVVGAERAEVDGVNGSGTSKRTVG